MIKRALTVILRLIHAIKSLVEMKANANQLDFMNTNAAVHLVTLAYTARRKSTNVIQTPADKMVFAMIKLVRTCAPVMLDTVGKTAMNAPSIVIRVMMKEL